MIAVCRQTKTNNDEIQGSFPFGQLRIRMMTKGYEDS